MPTPSVHFLDAARPDSDDVFPVYVYTDVVPRIGDHVHYYVEPHSMHSYEGAEPASIKGRVAKVLIEYRRFPRETVPVVSVYLDGYEITLPKNDK